MVIVIIIITIIILSTVHGGTIWLCDVNLHLDVIGVLTFETSLAIPSRIVAY